MAYATCDMCVEKLQSGDCDYRQPSFILQQLNRVLYECLHGQFCMTFIALVIDAHEQKVYYSNGGHPVPILLPNDQKDTRIKKTRKRFPGSTVLETPFGQRSSILGITENPTFLDQEKALKSNDRIVIYTDGITEAENEQKRQWGTRGVLKSLFNHQDMDIGQVKDHMVTELYQYNVQDDQFEDDITLLIIEYADRAHSLGQAS
jgi:serine phosphatase RsbU (regulator of sigma subunit)